MTILYILIKSVKLKKKKESENESRSVVSDSL